MGLLRQQQQDSEQAQRGQFRLDLEIYSLVVVLYSILGLEAACAGAFL